MLCKKGLIAISCLTLAACNNSSDSTGDVINQPTVNNQPTVDSGAVTVANEDAPYHYTFVASDQDNGDTLTLSAPNLPQWLAFDDTSGILSGTPDNADVGTHDVILQVSDGLADTTQTFTITVANTNDIPTITSTALTTATENSPYSYSFSASDQDIDDVLVFSASTLPPWLNFDGSNGVLSGTPGSDAVGSFEVILQAQDNSAAAASQAFTIEVAAAPDTQAPTANIIFPWAVSQTNAEQILVRGQASDRGNIATIKVNGITATTTVGADGEVNWQATINLPSANAVPIVVETQDELGNTNSEAAKSTVKTITVPTFFTIDNENHRLISAARFDDQIVMLDLNSNERESVQLPGVDLGTDFAYMPAVNKTIHAKLLQSGLELQLYATDLATAEVELLHSLALNIDLTQWFGAWITDLDYAASENAVYVSVIIPIRSPMVDNNKSAIYKYDLNTNTMVTVVDGTTDSGKKVKTRKIAPTDNGLLVFNGWAAHGLSYLNFDGSELSPLVITHTAEISAISIDVGQNQNFAYVTGMQGITKVDLATGVDTVLSMDVGQDEYNIGQVNDTGIDHQNNRLLVSTNNSILAVDLDTGVRSSFLSSGIGNGRSMLAARDFVMDDSNNLAYVADDGNNGVVILSIDLSSGDRTLVAAIDSDEEVFVRDLVFNPQNGQLWLILNEKIFQIDIASGTSSLISSGDSSDRFSAAILDASNNRLIVSDSANQSLVAVNLQDGSRSVISALDVKGTGPALAGGVGITWDSANNQAYVLSQSEGVLYQIDLASGDRTQLLDICTNSSGDDKLLPNYQGTQAVFFNQKTRQMVLTGETMLHYDIDSGVCKASDHYISASDMVLTNKNQLLTLDSGLNQVDFDSGSVVTISQ